MSNLNALLVQAQLGWKEPAANRNHIASLLDSAPAAFDLAVLPETFTTGFLGDDDHDAEGMDGPTVTWMLEQCEKHCSALVGSVVITESGRRYNRMIFAAAEGVLGYYDKRHLFSYGGEDRRYTAGDDRVIVDYRGWRINLQVCYDLRFPAWCRNRGDYDLMLLVANWPRKRIAHWSTLLHARAMENQSWVIGVNRVGEDGNGFVYPGCSVAHDPLGETPVKLGGEEECRLVELDLERVNSVRANFPFLNDADDFTIT